MQSETTVCLTRRRHIVARLCNALRRRTAASYWTWRLAAYGARSDLQRPAFLVGGRHIAIGDRTTVWYGSRLEALNGAADCIRIAIGDDCAIHPYAHIGAVDRISIGRGVLMASGVYITDHDHDFSDPSEPPISNRRVISAPVVIGDYAWLGERAMVLKGVSIGEHAVIGAGSIVTKDVPAYCVAVGSPARVIRRYSFSEKRWVGVDEWRE